MSITETIGNQGGLAGTLNTGLKVVSGNQTVTFTLYNRRVLPLDGSIFWVNSSVTNDGNVPTTFEAQGSLHHTTVNTQDPEDSISTHRMVFTSLDAVDQLSAISPTVLWMGETAGQRYAFSSRSSWYRQAALYHYSGDAVYPPFATQIVDNIDQLDLENRVVSNSLPIWLTINSLFPVYPSMLVPDNLSPPYASVEIREDDTHPIAAGPYVDKTGTRWQLARDRVRIVTYGVRNDVIMDWIDTVQAFCIANPETMGIMNSPIPRDAKRGQVEIATLAQKKVVEFEVDYYQTRARDISRQLILTALFDQFIVSPY